MTRLLKSSNLFSNADSSHLICSSVTSATSQPYLQSNFISLPLIIFRCSSVTLAFRFPALTLKYLCASSFVPSTITSFPLHQFQKPLSLINSLFKLLNQHHNLALQAIFRTRRWDLIFGTTTPFSLSPILLYCFGVDATTKTFC